MTGGNPPGGWIHQKPEDVGALTDVKVKTAKPKEKPYKLADGGGMYLLINANGSKYWRMKYRFAGISIGVYPDVTLADAREKRSEARKILAAGSEPGEVKKEENVAQKMGLKITFEAVARKWRQANGDRTSLHDQELPANTGRTSG